MTIMTKPPEMIYETIVISMDEHHQPHIAPFGVRERDGLILIAPFRPSTSLDNFLHTRSAVLNMTDDVRVFAGALAGGRDWPLHKAEKVDGFILQGSLAHRELELVNVEEDAVRPILFFRVVHAVNHQPFRGFNRAQAAVVELAVLVSRLDRLPIEKVEAEIAYLDIAMQKTAGEREWQAWQWLIDRVENHKAASSGLNQA